MRIRSIKPEFWRSNDVSSLSWESRLIFIGLWSYVDDNGVGLDKLASITADLFANDIEQKAPETFARVSRGLQELSDAGRIARYEVDGKRYLSVTNWDKHQRIDKPNKPRYPHLTSISGESREIVATPSREVRETPASGTEEQRNRGTEEQSSPTERSARRATRIDDPFIVTAAMRQWAAEKTPLVDVDRSTAKFVDYWRAKSGKNATKLDWVATWRNWLRSDQERAENRPGAKASPADRALAVLALGAEPLQGLSA